MEINIQFIKMQTSEHMEAFVIKKLEKLGKKFGRIIKAEVFYKLEKNPTGKGRVCDIQLSLPGPRIHASSNKEGFEFATDQTIKDLEKQLKKRKSEMKSYL